MHFELVTCVQIILELSKSNEKLEVMFLALNFVPTSHSESYPLDLVI